jgi:predicted nucleic acid-binding protein
MRLLLDTTVIIDCLRGSGVARDYVALLQSKPFISAMTVGELFAGLRTETEMRLIHQFLSGAEIVPIDDYVAEEAGHLRRRYGRSHGTGLSDAFIAASAILVGARLVTHNVKHFPMFDDLIVPYPR